MSKKVLIDILILVILFILLSGCGMIKTNSTNNAKLNTSETNFDDNSSSVESNNSMKSKIENRTNIIFDNLTEKEHFFKKEYELNEIRNFFGELTYFGGFSENIKNIREINSAFPILFLRNIDDTLLYTIYSIKNGGLFYVFFLLALETNEDGVLAEEPVIFLDENTTPVYFAYLSSLNDESDFNSIVEGKSTAEDVKKISFSYQTDEFRSSGYFSYSLLNNGNVVEIEYKKDKEEINSLENYIVYQKQTLTDEISKRLCYLAGVSKKDLPV